MESLVLELQKDILNQNISTTNILRKAFVVARKLNILDIEEWITSELNGYKKFEKIPQYRELNGQLKVWNPYHGWQSLFTKNAEFSEKLSRRNSNQTIPEIEKMISEDDGTGSFCMHFSKALETDLMKGMSVPLQPALLLSAAQLQGIIDCVRNNILDWALRLESQGILGNKMTFSQKEKKAAKTVTINIKNYIENMSDSQIQQDFLKSTQIYYKNGLDIQKVKTFIDALKNSLKDIPLSKNDSKELSSGVETVEAQIKTSKPKKNII